MNGQNERFDVVIEKFPALNKTSAEYDRKAFSQTASLSVLWISATWGTRP